MSPVARELRELPVPDGFEGVRLDQVLPRLFGLSRTVSAELISAGEVTVDGQECAKSARTAAGAWLSVLLPEPPTALEAPQPEPVDGLTIIHADDDIAVVDKPVGVAAHPSPGWSGPTVIAGLAAAGHRVSVHGPAERQGVVHRLDVGTSGVMVVAKSERAYSALKQAFKRREVDKRYRAVVHGHPDPLRGTIDAPIDRHPSHDYKWAVRAGGRASVTHYETLEAFPAASLVEVQLETGRTHQIRVHFSALRHPCVGDATYGADPSLTVKLGLTRQWLHACQLSFVHPGHGDTVEFRSDDPLDLAQALEVLRGEV